jgi:uncharacterized membrane protein YdjX (TVP38/TMEM64 family)
LPPAKPRDLARVAALLLFAAALIAIVTSDRLHDGLIHLLTYAERYIRAHPTLGIILFVALAAASAMLAFVSSAVIIPVGVYTWGKETTMLLLWLGWILGGLFAYSLSRYLGRRAVKLLKLESALKRFEHHISSRTPFPFVLLFQLALPSELPGYLLGLARYPPAKYLAALALAELPYALATVYLGDRFLQRQTYQLILIGVAIAAFSAWALRTLRSRAPES